MRAMSTASLEITCAIITQTAPTMDSTRIRLKKGRNRSGIPVSDWNHPLVLEVSTIAIPGQRLHERCGWFIGDVQGTKEAVTLTVFPTTHDVTIVVQWKSTKHSIS